MIHTKIDLACISQIKTFFLCYISATKLISINMYTMLYMIIQLFKKRSQKSTWFINDKDRNKQTNEPNKDNKHINKTLENYLHLCRTIPGMMTK